MVAFAYDRGIRKFDFTAADGFHTAEIVSDNGNEKIVRLKMKDVTSVEHYDLLDGVDVPSEGWFLDTGTRHYVRFVEKLDIYPIVEEGRIIRYHAMEFLPVGVNVNFVESFDGGLQVRTYEKGVEDETFACGTGIVASSIAAYKHGISPSEVDGDKIKYKVKARKDNLSVDFQSDCTDIWLTGPAALVAEIQIR